MNTRSCLCEGIEGRVPASRKSEHSSTRTSSRGSVAQSGEKADRMTPVPFAKAACSNLVDRILTSTFLTELAALLLSAAGFLLTYYLGH